MRWLPSEYILKGVYLGLLFYVALALQSGPDSWSAIGRVALFTVGGLALCLGIAAVRKLREGFRVRGRLPAFILFLLLESPGLVYAGILLGMFAGALTLATPAPAEGELGVRSWLLPAAAVGGAAGYGFWLLRGMRDRLRRFALMFVLAAAVVAAAVWYLHHNPDFLSDPRMFGITLLLGIPFFYLLTFAGEAEESEVEIGAMCAALGVGIWLVELTPTIRSLGFLIPVSLYYIYTWRVQPGLRVFKHTLRGHSYAQIGRYHDAIRAFQRALQLDPQNDLAREGLWAVHRSLDLDDVLKDPELLELIDIDLCLDRAASLLQRKPSQPQLEEAHRLLDLVLNQKPERQPAVMYWKAVAHLHAGFFDQAASELEGLLDPTVYAPTDPNRRMMLLPAWQLALTLHPEMVKRLGPRHLELPGRRLEAIAALERHLEFNPDDPAVKELKRLLYAGVTEAEYEAANPRGRAAADFDHDYVLQLGQSLINDPAHWRRGAEYLRLALRGHPEKGPALFALIAQAHERAGDDAGKWQALEQARQAGLALGPKALPDEDRHGFFATVKLLAEHAVASGNLDAAIHNYQLYTEYERSGLETLRILADLFEKRGDPLSALRIVEKALVYSPKDRQLLDQKDKYYYSVMPEHLQERLEQVKGFFDVAYCLKKAQSLLNVRDASLDLIDWAAHLAELAQVVQPNNLSAKVLRARIRLRKGLKEEAVSLLEEVRNPKPEKFASSDDEEAWFAASRLLGELYLYDLGKPEQAVQCFQDYKKSVKSGADTMFRLGQAYEALGDHARAVRCYEHVTAYDGHPLQSEAREALYRLKS